MSPTTIDAPADGGSYSIEVTSNAEWTVTASADWITLDTESGKDDGTVGVTVAAADKKEVTKGEIVFKYGEKGSASVQVTREAKAAIPFTIDDSEIKIVPLNGGTYTIKVQSESSWNVACSDKTVTFSNKTDNSVDVTIPSLANSENIARDEWYMQSYEVVFSDGENTATSSINQQRPYLYFHLIWPTYVPKNGGTYSVTVKANISWTADARTNSADSATPTWVAVESAKGTGDGSFNVYVMKNETGKQRECKIYARHGKWNDGYTLTQRGE